MFDFATQGKSTITGFPFLMRIRYLQDTYVDRFVIFEYICLKLYYKWWLCTALVHYIKLRCVIRFVVCQNLAKKGIILTKTRRSKVLNNSQEKGAPSWTMETKRSKGYLPNRWLSTYPSPYPCKGSKRVLQVAIQASRQSWCSKLPPSIGL